MMYAGVPSFFGLGLEDGHVPSFWLLLFRIQVSFSVDPYKKDIAVSMSWGSISWVPL